MLGDACLRFPPTAASASCGRSEALDEVADEMEAEREEPLLVVEPLSLLEGEDLKVAGLETIWRRFSWMEGSKEELLMWPKGLVGREIGDAGF